MPWPPLQIENSFQSPHEAAVSSSLTVLVPLLTPSSPGCQDQPAQSAQDINSARLYMQQNHVVLLMVPSIFLGFGCCCMMSWWFWWAVRTPRFFPQLGMLGLSSASPTSATTSHCFPIQSLPTIPTLNVSWTKKGTHSGHSGNLHKCFIHFVKSLFKHSQRRRSQLEKPASPSSDLDINLWFLWRLFCLWSYRLLWQ